MISSLQEQLINFRAPRHYLDWHDRLKALVEIDVLPATRTQPVPQTFERMALETAKKNGRLGALWDVVMRSVPTEKRGENPFAGL